MAKTEKVTCPYCGARVRVEPGARRERAHMMRAHPDIVWRRLAQAGYTPGEIQALMNVDWRTPTIQVRHRVGDPELPSPFVPMVAILAVGIPTGLTLSLPLVAQLALNVSVALVSSTLHMRRWRRRHPLKSPEQLAHEHAARARAAAWN